jgi:hypothetical protein
MNLSLARILYPPASQKNFELIPHVASAIGAQFTTYGVADALKPIYGSHPVGVAILVRLRPVSGRER